MQVKVLIEEQTFGVNGLLQLSVCFFVLVFPLTLGLDNRIQSSGNCSVTQSERFRGLFADCSGRNLTSVPHLVGNITALDLSRNIIILQTRVFNTFPFLIYLKLSYNDLKILPRDVFNGCAKLVCLDLSDNKLKYNYISFPHHVFDPLKNIQVLNLGFNDHTNCKDYPDKTFQSLTNLQNLTIDTFPMTTFGEGFEAMRDLMKLQLSGHEAKCDLEGIYNDTFSIFNSTKLLILDLSDCRNLTHIDADSFAALTHLQRLHIDDTHVGLHQCLQALRSFAGRNMSAITLENVQLIDVPAIQNVRDEILEQEDLNYFNLICLSKVNLANNHILYLNLTDILLSRTATCLKYVSVRDNSFFGLYYLTNDLIMLLSKLNIEYLDISNFYGNCQSEKRKSTHNYLSDIPDNVTLLFPSKMKTLIVDSMSVSSILKSDTHLSFFNSNVLETVSISHYGKLILEGSFSGFHRLTTLKLAYNNYMRLSESFFDTFPSLQNLYLNDVTLPEDYFYKNGKRLFSTLHNLVILDLSGNEISRLPEEIFANNHRLKYLMLSNNNFPDIPININDVPSLLFLNLSYNKIRFIDEIRRNQLDDYAEKYRTFRLSISGNNFVCFCNDVFFVFWLKATDYISDNRSEFMCITQSGVNKWVKDVDGEQLWQSCVGMTFFFIALSLMAFGSLAFVSSLLIMKHKTQIICFLKKLIGRSVIFPKRRDFRFDVFLGYGDDDYPQVYFDLGRCLEDRLGYCVYMYHKDSIPGEDRACSILYGINNSWKTILFMTNTFVDDHWSFYTMQVAVYATSEMIPNRIILVKDPTYTCDIPTFILCSVDEQRILTIPEANDDEAWEKLKKLIE